jgi:2-dehydropantoate 2-reductase
LLHAFQAAKVEAEISEDVEATLWTKFVLLSAVSATNAITRGPTGPVLKDPDMRQMFIACMHETVAVAHARGVRLDEDIVENQLRLAKDFPPDVKASLLQDLEAGKRLEVKYLSGTVSRIGAELGVSTPVHSTVYAALKPFANG